MRRSTACESGRRAVVLAALAFFFLLAAYYVIRPVRDQLAGAMGSVVLPWFYAGTFLAMLVVAPAFGWLSSQFPRRRLLGWSYGFFIACLVAFVPLFAAQARIGARALGIGFFIIVSGLVVPAVVNVAVLIAVALFGAAQFGIAGMTVALIPLMLIVTRGFAYGVTKPASDALYTRTPREIRYKGKNFVDTAVWRFGDVTVASTLDGLRALGASLGVIGAVSAMAAGLAGVFGWRAVVVSRAVKDRA